MKNHTLLLVLAVVVACAASTRASNVQEIEFEKFGKVIAEGHWIIEFFSPSCSACQAFKPQFEKIADQLIEKYPGIQIGKVDASKSDAFREEFDVQAFPTIVSIKEGGDKKEKYAGDLTIKNVIRFVDKLDAPALTPLSTKEELAEEVEANTVVFLTNCAAEGSDQAAAFDKVANKFHLTDPTVAFTVGCGLRDDTEPGHVYAIRKQHIYKTNDFESGKFDKWVKMMKRPLMEELTPMNFMEHATEHPSVVVAVVDWDNKSQESADFLEMMSRVAPNFIEKHAGFTHIDGSFAPSKGLATSRGIPDGHYPSFFVWNINANEWFVDITVDTEEKINAWLTDVFAGKVQGQQPKKEDLVGNEKSEPARDAENDPDYMGDGAIGDGKEEL